MTNDIDWNQIEWSLYDKLSSLSDEKLFDLMHERPLNAKQELLAQIIDEMKQIATGSDKFVEALFDLTVTFKSVQLAADIYFLERSNPDHLRIGDMVLRLGEHPRWLQFSNDPRGLYEKSGRLDVDRANDVAWLEAYDIGGAARLFKSVVGLRAGLPKLPPWGKTRWAIQCDDYGVGTLWDCRTGSEANLNDQEPAQFMLKMKTAYLSVANQVLQGEFDNYEPSTCERLISRLRCWWDLPPCRQAAERLLAHRQRLGLVTVTP